MLRDVDTNIFEKLTDNEKEKLKTQIDKLVTVADRFDTIVSDDEETIDASKPETIEFKEKETSGQIYKPAVMNTKVPDIICMDQAKPIKNLGFKQFFKSRINF